MTRGALATFGEYDQDDKEADEVGLSLMDDVAAAACGSCHPLLCA